MNSFPSTTTPNFDNLLLQTLMNRLQLRPSPSTNNNNNPLNPPLSLEDLLLNNLTNLSDSESDNEAEYDNPTSSKTQLAKEESRLEKEIVKKILTGKWDSLKPNSGQAVSIGEHHICVGFHEDSGSDYRVWEWHGHIMLFDEENGYTPEYIYGNYFERVTGKTPMMMKKKEQEENESVDDGDDEKEDEKVGLRELIESGDSSTARILHRNIKPGLQGSS